MGLYSHADQQGWINLDDHELASTRTEARSTPGALAGRRNTCNASCGGQGRDRTVDLPIFSRTLVPTELPGRATEGYQSACFPD